MSDAEASKDLPPSVIERTASAAVAPVLKIGGAISGFVAISYLIGLAYVKAYFSSLGAPWVVDLLSYGQIAKAGSVVTSTVVVMAFASLVDWARTGAAPKSLENWARFSALIGLVPIAISLLPESLISPSAENLLMLAAGFLIAASAGFTLAELLVRFRHSNYKWTAHQLNLAFVIQMLLLTGAPAIYGHSTAKLDLDGKSLPLVEGEDLESGGPWRLVRSLDSGLLVVAEAPVSASQKHSFRIVPAGNKVTISSTSHYLVVGADGNPAVQGDDPMLQV